MKGKYPIIFLCQLMRVSKSGYYKWKKRQGTLNRYESDRLLLTEFLIEQHRKHPSHGYHMLAEDVFQETGWVFSHNLAHKCCKQAGIRSKARKYRYKKPGEEHIKFPNEVKGNWNADKPIQIVVSDMTVFKIKAGIGNGHCLSIRSTMRSLRTKLHQLPGAANHIITVWQF